MKFTPERLAELSVGYDLDCGGYQFENPAEGSPLDEIGAVVWDDPDLDYMGLQDMAGADDCAVLAFEVGGWDPQDLPEWIEEGPLSWDPNCSARLVLINCGKLNETDHTCQCHGRLHMWTGAAGDPGEPIDDVKVRQWLAEDKAVLAKDTNLGEGVCWDFTGNCTDKPHPECPRCQGDGSVLSEGGVWGFYKREYIEADDDTDDTDDTDDGEE